MTPLRTVAFPRPYQILKCLQLAKLTSCQKRRKKLPHRTRKRGQRFALTVALVVATAGIIALLMGQGTTAAVIIGSGIASSIAAMLLGHMKGKQKPQKTLMQVRKKEDRDILGLWRFRLRTGL